MLDAAATDHNLGGYGWLTAWFEDKELGFLNAEQLALTYKEQLAVMLESLGLNIEGKYMSIQIVPGTLSIIVTMEHHVDGNLRSQSTG